MSTIVEINTMIKGIANNKNESSPNYLIKGVLTYSPSYSRQTLSQVPAVRDTLKFSKLGTKGPLPQRTLPSPIWDQGQGQMIRLQSNTKTGIWTEAWTTHKDPSTTSGGEGWPNCQKGSGQSKARGAEQKQKAWSGLSSTELSLRGGSRSSASVYL